jgi:hypothetical protein
MWSNITNMRRNITMAALIAGILISAMLCRGASLPLNTLRPITETLERDFTAIDEIRTISMSDDQTGRFDLVVVGAGRIPNGGWRVEVLTVDHHRLTKRWDSVVSAKEMEFDASGPQSIHIYPEDYDYNLVIEGCAQHACYDGISGFLVFVGKEEKTYKAKLVTRGLDRPPADSPQYDVTFSKNISDDARKVLQDAICTSTAISSKQGLQFSCDTRK